MSGRSPPTKQGSTDHQHLVNLITNLKTLPVQKIPTTNARTSPRRAAVAIIIRVRPNSVVGPQHHKNPTRDPLAFLNLEWVQNGEPEILFVRRAVNQRDRWSGHMAFPGGKADPDETEQEAAERETVEEIGLDISTDEFLCLGALDDRDVKPAASAKAVLLLSPFVYLQLSPSTPPLVLLPEEIASIHWIPLSFFLAAARDPRRWRAITFPMARNLLPARWFAALTSHHTQPLPPSTLPGPVGTSQSGPLVPTTPAQTPTWRRTLNLGLEKSLTLLLGTYSWSGILLPTRVGEIVTPLATPLTPAFPTSRPSFSHTAPGIEHSASYGYHPTPPHPEPHRPPLPGQSTPTRLLLWGLTLWMTSDLVDMCHQPDDVPEVALVEMGAPRYSLWDVDWVFGVLAREGGGGLGAGRVVGGAGRKGRRPRRKPAVAVTVRTKLEYYHAIRISAAAAFGIRAFVCWVAVANTRRLVRWVKANL